MSDNQCAYCGRPPTTKDHIPPKKLFPQPWPDDLLTVPSCEACNNESSEDDEYFIWMVSLCVKSVGRDADRTRKQRLDPKSATPRRRRMATRIINSSVPVEVFSSGGIYLGDAIAYDVDGKRVSRVLSRIVRG